MVKISPISGIKGSGCNVILEALPYLNKATLSSIIGKDGENLNYWVKRLIKSKDIIYIKKGLYASGTFLLKISGQPFLLDRYREYLAYVIRQPSYISLEYALAKYGAIQEAPFAITSITTKSSRKFNNEMGSFIFRNIKTALFTGYTEEAFLDKRYFIASPAKALFDFVYLRKFGRSSFTYELAEGLRINWDVFKKPVIKEFETYAKLSNTKKMDTFINIIIKRGLI